MSERKITMDEIESHELIHGRDRLLYHLVSDYREDCIHHEAYNYFTKFGLLLVREFTIKYDPST